MQVGFAWIVFFEWEAITHFHFVGSFGEFVFFEVFIFVKEKIGLDFDFVIKMESMLLLDVLGKSLLIGLKMTGK